MSDKKETRGRKPHKPTEETRAKVEALASFGVPQVKIGEYIGVHDDTLRKHYSEELRTAAIEKNNEVATFLYSVASGDAVKDGASYADAVRAAMFWLKTQAQWSETSKVDMTSSDGSMSPVSVPPEAVASLAAKLVGDDN